MISTNVISFVKKIVKTGDDDASNSSSAGTIGKIRQTVATGMKEIRGKAARRGSKAMHNGDDYDEEELTDEDNNVLDHAWTDSGIKEQQPKQQVMKTSARKSSNAVPAIPALTNPSMAKTAAVNPAPAKSSCRICRKTISKGEFCYTCTECSQHVCDDCASYRKESEEEHGGWRCSFCRRRQDRLGVESNMRRIPSCQRMDMAMRQQSLGEEGRRDSIDSLGPHKSPPPFSEHIRRMSSTKLSSPETSAAMNIPLSVDRMSDTSKSSESFQSDQKHSFGGSKPPSIDQIHRPDALTQPKTSDAANKSQFPLSASKTTKQAAETIRLANTAAASSGFPLGCNTERRGSRQIPTVKPDQNLNAARSMEPKAISPQAMHPQATTKSGHVPEKFVGPAKFQKACLPTSDKHRPPQVVAYSKCDIDRRRLSVSGSLIPDRPLEIKIKTGQKPIVNNPEYDEWSSCCPGQPKAQTSPSYRTKHSSLEGYVKERRSSVDSQRSLRLMPASMQPAPGPPSPAPLPAQYRSKISMSESSIEDKSPDEDAEIMQNRLRRKTRFQRQKTFIDEHDAEPREEWVIASYGNDEIVSSFESSSAFDSFENEAEETYNRHGHGYQQARPLHHIASDVTLYHRRRGSDSAEYGDMNSEFVYRRSAQKTVMSRRYFSSRTVGSDYEADPRYYSAQQECLSLKDRGVPRHQMEKSVSVDDPEMVGLRFSGRRQSIDASDDRQRSLKKEFFQDPSRGTSVAYQCGYADTRTYQNQHLWTRGARSLELSVDASHVRRSSLTEGDRIKIVIDDVDAGGKGYRTGSEEVRPSSRRNLPERGNKSLDWSDSPDWAYVDAYDKDNRNLNVSSRPKASSASDVSRESEYHHHSSGRRKLPMTPDQTYHGEIALSVWFEPTREDLGVNIVAAKGLRRRKESAGILPRAFAKLRMLPYSGFRPIDTPTVNATTNPKWNKTCVFPGIVRDDIIEKTIEISIWDYEPDEEARYLLGLVSLPLRKVEMKDEMSWFPLTLRPPQPQTHPHKASSTGMLVSTPAHDMARRLLTRGVQREILQSQSLTDEAPVMYYGSDGEQGVVKSTSMDALYAEWDPNDPEAYNAYCADDIRMYGQYTQDSLPVMYNFEPDNWPKRVSYDVRCINSDSEAGKDRYGRPSSRELARRASRGNDLSLEHAARGLQH